MIRSARKFKYALVVLGVLGLWTMGCTAPEVAKSAAMPLKANEAAPGAVLTAEQKRLLGNIRHLKTQRDSFQEQLLEEKESAAALKSLIDRTYYAQNAAVPVYGDLDQLGLAMTLKPKQSVVLKEVVVNGRGDKVGMLESVGGRPAAGYVRLDQLVRDPALFISQPFEGVDYSRMEKTPDSPGNPRVTVKGIYVSQASLGSGKLNDLIQLANDTEINAFIIDVVDDYGNTLFFSETAEAMCPDANGKSGIKDLTQIMKALKENQIYAIARIVAFRSPRYAGRYPERAITYRSTGENYAQGDGLDWGSAFDESLWAYTAGIAKEAAAVGFNEIQLDYVRFPATGEKLDRQLDYHNGTNRSKVKAIQDFLLYVKKELEGSQVYLTADVFGWAASDLSDVQIGQHWEAVSNVVDYMAPMMYPSHYGPGNFGLPVPDAKPYETVFRSGLDALDRNANLQVPASIRPWIQDFTATWVKGHIRYGPETLRAQIQALEDLGIHEYMIWNPRNNYHREGLKKEVNQ